MATGIVEKSNNGLFENEIEMVGKYATIVRHLKDKLGLFATFRETYITAAIIGFVHNRIEEKDESDKVQAASIFPAELNKRKQDLRLLYRIIMLVRDEPNFTIEDYMNRAFRDDAEEGNIENLKKNMMLFNSYACGGLLYLQEKFGELDRPDDLVCSVYEWIHEFASDMNLIEAEELPDFSPTFS